MNMDAFFQKLVSIALGLCLVVPFGYRICTYGIFKYQSNAVDGAVVKPLRGGDIGGRAILEYKDLNNNTHEIVSKYKTHWFFAPRPGERIRVLFQPQEPEVAIVDSFFHYIALPLFCVVLGISLMYSAVRRKRVRNENDA